MKRRTFLAGAAAVAASPAIPALPVAESEMAFAIDCGVADSTAAVCISAGRIYWLASDGHRYCSFVWETLGEMGKSGPL